MFVGVNVAVLHEGRVLLTQREDWEVWCLPGGAMDVGESIAAAAMRETREETGLDVRLTRLVGTYTRPHWGNNGSTIVLFAAKQIGGTLRGQPEEVVDLNFFAPNALPNTLAWGQRERLRDVFSGTCGIVRASNVRQPEGWPATRAEQYALRDASGLSRQAFYLRYAALLGPEESVLEVGLNCTPV